VIFEFFAVNFTCIPANPALSRRYPIRPLRPIGPLCPFTASLWQLFHHSPQTVFVIATLKNQFSIHNHIQPTHFQRIPKNENRSHRGKDKFPEP
jgi:hypothetical protein